MTLKSILLCQVENEHAAEIQAARENISKERHARGDHYQDIYNATHEISRKYMDAYLSGLDPTAPQTTQ